MYTFCFCRHFMWYVLQIGYTCLDNVCLFLICFFFHVHFPRIYFLYNNNRTYTFATSGHNLVKGTFHKWLLWIQPFQKYRYAMKVPLILCLLLDLFNFFFFNFPVWAMIFKENTTCTGSKRSLWLLPHSANKHGCWLSSVEGTQLFV